MTCKSCNDEIVPEDALKRSPYSWPHLQAVWHVCPKCGIGNHLRFETDTVSVIEITGAPGPTWERLKSQRRPGIQIKAEPEYFHVWIDRIEYVVPARA